jgi:hypothetical protein
MEFIQQEEIAKNILVCIAIHVVLVKLFRFSYENSLLVLSVFHSLTVAIYSAFILYEVSKSPYFKELRFEIYSENVINMSLSYFAADIILNFANYFGVQYKYWQGKPKIDKGILLHHLIVPVAMIYSHQVGQYYYTALALLSEFCPLFLHICTRKKHFPPLIFNASAILLIVTYFFFRVVNFPYITFTAINFGYPEISLAMGTLAILNWYWFYKIVTKATREFLKKEI